MLAQYPFEGVFQIVTFWSQSMVWSRVRFPEHAKIQKEIYENLRPSGNGPASTVLQRRKVD